jgi:glycosyltransferase involved in cell wall biosynthesis
MIRVLHVTEDHSAANTGISSAVDALTRCVLDEIRPAILCVGEETLSVRPGVSLTAFPTRGLAKTWRYAAGSSAALARAVAESDVVHLHGLWMWVQWAAAREAARQKKPFVLSSHGMLEPWIWQRQSALNRLKKYLYWNGIAYPAFRRAALIHALTAQEARTLNGYFPGQKTLLIPHGIDLDAADAALAGLPPQKKGEPPYFLFLGRLHPVKAIHLLLRAFARLPANPLVLKLAGPTQPQEAAYAESLRQLAAELNLGERVVFTGPVQGPAKWQLYRDAWAFCLPSFSEVIGLVNLEAAAARTPVITSYESGVVEEWDQEGGLRVRPHEDSILEGLQKALAWSPAEREGRGRALRALVERQYRWERVGMEWAAGYQGLTGADNHA